MQTCLFCLTPPPSPPLSYRDRDSSYGAETAATQLQSRDSRYESDSSYRDRDSRYRAETAAAQLQSRDSSYESNSSYRDRDSSYREAAAVAMDG